MDRGFVISGIGHALLIGFLLFSDLFSPDPLPPPDVAEVVLMSEEDFAALTRPEVGEQQPRVGTLDPEPLEIPDTTDAPATPAQEDVAPSETSRPAPQPTPPDEAPQDVPDQPAPLPPQAEAEDTPPDAPAPPQPVEDAPTAPQSVPRPAERVASEAAPPPPPDAEDAPTLSETTAPTPAPDDTEIVEEETPQAPDEAATEIVTEADRPANAPETSRRPPSRPARPVQTATAPQTEATTTEAASENVRDAVEGTIAGLEELVDQAPQAGIPAGPPITQGEKEAFILAIRRCWLVDTGSESANVIVAVRFQMTQDGRVVQSSIRQSGAQGGSDAAIRTAFENARRAILRCGASGYDLPPEKYGQWQEVEVTFNPSDMRVR